MESAEVVCPRCWGTGRLPMLGFYGYDRRVCTLCSGNGRVLQVTTRTDPDAATEAADILAHIEGQVPPVPPIDGEMELRPSWDEAG